MRTLLVYPPHGSVWFPYLSTAALSAVVKQQSADEVLVRDLNVDFFDFLTSPGAAGDHGCGAGASDPLWSQIRDAKERLRSKTGFPREEDLQSALRLIQSGLESASARYRSTQLSLFDGEYQLQSARRHIFPFGPTTPEFRMAYSPLSSIEVRAAVEDGGENPFLHYYREKFVPELLDLQPDFVGISVAFPQQHIPAFTLAAVLKQVLPKAHVCLGGAQISKLAPSIRNSPDFHRALLPLVDTVVIGEGERSLPSLLAALRSGGSLLRVPNLVYRQGDRLLMTAPAPPVPLTDLPTPDFSDLPLSGYLGSGHLPSLPFQVTRGCYWGKCSFCDSSALLGGYRTRPPQTPIDEIFALQERYGIDGIVFADEALPPSFMGRLSQSVIERDRPLAWSTYARLDGAMKPAALEAMARGGCHSLFLGLEAAAPRVNRLMNKGVNSELTAERIRLLADLGINVNIFAIVGFPGETREEAERTLAFLMEHRDRINSLNLVPFQLEQGGSVFREAARFGVSNVTADPRFDLKTSCDYDVAGGLSMEESAELCYAMNVRLRRAGVFNPVFRE